MTTVGTLVRERKRVLKPLPLEEVESLREMGRHQAHARRVARPEISTERAAMASALMLGTGAGTPRVYFQTV